MVTIPMLTLTQPSLLPTPPFNQPFLTYRHDHGINGSNVDHGPSEEDAGLDFRRKCVDDVIGEVGRRNPQLFASATESPNHFATSEHGEVGVHDVGGGGAAGGGGAVGGGSRGNERNGDSRGGKGLPMNSFCFVSRRYEVRRVTTR